MHILGVNVRSLFELVRKELANCVSPHAKIEQVTCLVQPVHCGKPGRFDSQPFCFSLFHVMILFETYYLI